MSNEKDTLGNRMKQYEQDALNLNESHCPVIIRLDGNSFHTWVKKAKLVKPFDECLLKTMQETALAVCKTIPGCVMGYTQSDEISVVVRCDQSEKSQAWFDNRIQKLCSISASICSVNFNTFARKYIGEDRPLAYFDSRVIYLPDMNECINNFIWRQNDCVKNSVSALAQSMFSPKELNGKNQKEQMEIMKKKGVDWNDLETYKKYGTFIHRRKSTAEFQGTTYERKEWYIDLELPRFTEEKKCLEEAYNF